MTQSCNRLGCTKLAQNIMITHMQKFLCFWKVLNFVFNWILKLFRRRLKGLNIFLKRIKIKSWWNCKCDVSETTKVLLYNFEVPVRRVYLLLFSWKILEHVVFHFIMIVFNNIWFLRKLRHWRPRRVQDLYDLISCIMFIDI